jgi:hypothetical protein
LPRVERLGEAAEQRRVAEYFDCGKYLLDRAAAGGDHLYNAFQNRDGFRP